MWRRRIARRLRLWALALDPPPKRPDGFSPHYVSTSSSARDLYAKFPAAPTSDELLAQLWRSHGIRGIG